MVAGLVLGLIATVLVVLVIVAYDVAILGVMYSTWWRKRYIAWPHLVVLMFTPAILILFISTDNLRALVLTALFGGWVLLRWMKYELRA